jgi:hypothetical protein
MELADLEHTVAPACSGDATHFIVIYVAILLV